MTRISFSGGSLAGGWGAGPAGFRLLLLAAFAALLIAVQPAKAQLVDVEEHAEDEVRFAVTPYLFLPVSTTGTATIGGVSADVDLGLSDIFDALNLAGALRAEAGYGRFSVIVDGYYANLGGSASATLPGPAGGSAKVNIDFRQGWVAVMGAYRIDQGLIDAEGAGYAIDAGVGVRYNSLRQEVTANVDIGVGPGLQTKIGGTEDWFEPVLMARAGLQLNDRWGLGARAEIGGFGAGGSDLQWNVLLGGDYRAWENTSLKFGWQFYGIDYSTNRSDGRFAYDVFQTGPYMAATFRF